MPVDPLITNNHIDSCAFDPKYAPEDSASAELFKLAEAGLFQLNIAHSTQKEIQHPNTPAWVKRKAADRIYTLPVGLTTDELALRAAIQRTLAGNGKPENVRQDAEHVFEAQKYGGHFITTDNGILGRAGELKKLCGICIVRPTEFLATVKRRLAERQ
jgi:hypothetical protein